MDTSKTQQQLTETSRQINELSMRLGALLVQFKELADVHNSRVPGCPVSIADGITLPCVEGTGDSRMYLRSRQLSEPIIFQAHTPNAHSLAGQTINSGFDPSGVSPEQLNLMRSRLYHLKSEFSSGNTNLDRFSLQQQIDHLDHQIHLVETSSSSASLSEAARLKTRNSTGFKYSQVPVKVDGWGNPLPPAA